MRSSGQVSFCHKCKKLWRNALNWQLRSERDSLQWKTLAIVTELECSLLAVNQKELGAFLVSVLRAISMYTRFPCNCCLNSVIFNKSSSSEKKNGLMFQPGGRGWASEWVSEKNAIKKWNWILAICKLETTLHLIWCNFQFSLLN